MMAEYFHVPLMKVWQSRPETANEVEAGRREHSFATFVLDSLCHQIVDGRLTVAPDFNGRDFDDFLWQIECLYLALNVQSTEYSK